MLLPTISGKKSGLTMLKLTWSRRRAFWALSGFLYSTNPKPIESKVPVRRERGLAELAGNSDNIKQEM